VGTYRGKDIKEIKKTNFIFNLLRIPYNKTKRGAEKYKPKAAIAWTSIKAFLLQ
jgi:hypothetical protein